MTLLVLGLLTGLVLLALQARPGDAPAATDVTWCVCTSGGRRQPRRGCPECGGNGEVAR